MRIHQCVNVHCNLCKIVNITVKIPYIKRVFKPFHNSKETVIFIINCKSGTE